MKSSEIKEQNQYLLNLQHQFRLAADAVTDAWMTFPFISAIALTGSVACTLYTRRLSRSGFFFRHPRGFWRRPSGFLYIMLNVFPLCGQSGKATNATGFPPKTAGMTGSRRPGRPDGVTQTGSPRRETRIRFLKGDGYRRKFPAFGNIGNSALGSLNLIWINETQWIAGTNLHVVLQQSVFR